MTTLAVYEHAGASWRLEVGGPIDLQRRAGGPEWVTVRHNVGEPIGAGLQVDYGIYLKSLVVELLASQHAKRQAIPLDDKFKFIDEAQVFTPEKFAVARVYAETLRTIPLLDLCTELDTKARAAARRTSSPLRVGLNGRYYDVGGDIGQAFTDELQAHAVATQPLVVIALVAKLREAQELLLQATALAGMPPEEWTSSKEPPSDILRRFQGAVINWSNIEVP